MHSVEGGFFLSSEWEGGKISWQEKVRTYFSRYHLSCTRIFSCCQGVADIWQPLFFKPSFFCSNGLPQALLKNSSASALKWARSVALERGRSHNPVPQQQQRNFHPLVPHRNVMCRNQRLHTGENPWQWVSCVPQSKVCSALPVLSCGVQPTPGRTMVIYHSDHFFMHKLPPALLQPPGIEFPVWLREELPCSPSEACSTLQISLPCAAALHPSRWQMGAQSAEAALGTSGLLCPHQTGTLSLELRWCVRNLHRLSLVFSLLSGKENKLLYFRKSHLLYNK